MGEVLLGILALVFIMFMLRMFVTANPKTLVKMLRYAGAVALAGLAVWLFLSERIGGAVFMASAAWGLFTGGHIVPGGWPHYRFPFPGGGGRTSRTSAGGQTSRVRTAWVEMELDHDSGEMRGTILQGAHVGKSLDQLDRETLLAFFLDAANDPESERLMEAYLDRTLGADWRAPKDEPKDETPPPPRGQTGMSRAEALKVLGLQEGANEDAIRAAHKKLMMQNHPDRGGSDYLASKINEAKDVLLG